MSERPLLEVCVDSLDGCLAAAEGGANRVELCAALSEGGLTPSAGTIEAARAACALPIMVMIRPRGGDFVYSALEIDAMRRDIGVAKELGAHGVVLGALRPGGTVDEERTRELVAIARPMFVTFHRAFDETRDPFEALETLVRIGLDRVLTSGQAASVVGGLDRLAALVRAARGRIVVMPGGGVRESNVRELVARTGAHEVHSSAGGGADAARVRRLVDALRSSKE